MAGRPMSGRASSASIRPFSNSAAAARSRPRPVASKACALTPARRRDRPRCVRSRHYISAVGRFSEAASASRERGVSSPIVSIASRNNSRSSALSIASALRADHLDAEFLRARRPLQAERAY